MGNKLPKTMHIGTIGELLVQLRLLEYGIQAAPPIKDSGNDLIAIRGEVVRFIQVKTSHGRITSVGGLPGVYHIVALVELEYSEGDNLLIDQSRIFVFRKDEAIAEKRELSQAVVNELWNE